jgi:hypothetical protein
VVVSRAGLAKPGDATTAPTMTTAAPTTVACHRRRDPRSIIGARRR